MKNYEKLEKVTKKRKKRDKSGECFVNNLTLTFHQL